MKKQMKTLYTAEIRKIKSGERAAKRLSTAFGGPSFGDAPPLDCIVAMRLRGALNIIDFPLLDACWQRGILSDRLTSAVSLARFLSIALPLARAAQDVTGVPASYLVGELFLKDAGEIREEDSDLLARFMGRARALKGDPRFASVIRALGDKKKYEAEVARFGKRIDDSDLADLINEYALSECDTLHGNAS